MKFKMTIARVAFCVVVLCTALAGCNTFGRRHPGDTFTDTQFSATRAEAEDRLRQLVREHVLHEQAHDTEESAPIVRRRPYYFREYVVYPDGPDEFSVDFRELDSRIRPLLAEVTLNKVRYSTRMHRKYDRAAADKTFFRDTGVETLVFEWRSGRWTRTGAIFDALTTEEYVAGEWMPRREETERVIPGEDQPGWFGRVWQRIRGGE